MQVRSAYQIDDVNLYSKKVIRYAIGLCCFNVLIAIIASAAQGGNAGVVADAVVSIIINGIVLMLAIQCVKQKNKICCCGLASLDFYRYFLMINLFFNSLSILFWAIVVAIGYYWTIIELLYYIIVFYFNLNQLRFSRKIKRALAQQVQPLNATTPTAAVVQTTPTYAQVELDTRASGNPRPDPNGYGG